MLLLNIVDVAVINRERLCASFDDGGHQTDHLRAQRQADRPLYSAIIGSGEADGGELMTTRTSFSVEIEYQQQLASWQD
jgi:hypothetical protein